MSHSSCGKVIFLKIDMHTHSKYSKDGSSEVREMFDRAESKGLDGLAITDHYDVRAWKEAEEISEEKGMFFIPGEEVKILDEDGKCNGEVLLYFMKRGIGSMTIEKINKEVRKQGGLIFVAHPFSRTRHTPKNVKGLLRYVDGIEGFNARSRFASTNKKASGFASKHGIPTVAGSDGHIPLEVGCGYTEVEGASDLEDFKKKIEQGKGISRGKKVNSFIYYASQLRGRV